MPAGYYAPTIRLLWQTLESYGIAPASVFAACGISPDVLADPDARVSSLTAERLWADLPRLSGDPLVGLRTAEVLHPSHLGALGFAWLASADLRTALQRLVRYVHMVTELRHMELIDNGDELELVTRYLVEADSTPVRADASVAMLVRMCRWNLGEDFSPRMVELQRVKPADAGRYRDLFRCPVYFGCGRDAVTVAAADADRIATGNHPQLAELSEELVCEYLDGLDLTHLVHQVQAEIGSRLPNGVVRVDPVARALCMSVRTLQRRLAEHDTSFRQQVEATRRGLAEHYLGELSMSITEVAFRAGFSDMSAFSKTVRQWTGLSPRDFRKRLSSNHPHHQGGQVQASW